VKKGEPLKSIQSKMVTKIKIGDNKIKPTNAAVKSKHLLKKLLYNGI